MPIKSSLERDIIRASRRPSRGFPHCSVCGEPIFGRAVKVSDRPLRYACNKCNNEASA